MNNDIIDKIENIIKEEKKKRENINENNQNSIIINITRRIKKEIFKKENDKIEYIEYGRVFKIVADKKYRIIYSIDFDTMALEISDNKILIIVEKKLSTKEYRRCVFNKTENFNNNKIQYIKKIIEEKYDIKKIYNIIKNIINRGIIENLQ